MGGATLVVGLLLPMFVGISVLLAGRPGRRPLSAPGEIAWMTGAGYLAGAFLLTLWMRALSMAGIRFGIVSVGLPLAALAAAVGYRTWRRDDNAVRDAVRGAFDALFFPPDLQPTGRLLWRFLLGWIVLRFVLLGLEVAWQPLYPWEAWTQWATKARVWYELGRLVPFAPSEAWLAADGTLYFDALPGAPPTVPLLQVWACIALGRWDDTLMNWPWWQIAAALAIAVYGALRSLGMAALAALAAAYLVASIPLLDLHVALAGYADLPMSAYYACAALALLRWARSGDVRDAATLGLLAFACTQIRQPGLAWMTTLVPGIIVVLYPRLGLKLAAAALGAMLLLLAVVAQTSIAILGRTWHLEFRPAWSTLYESYLLLGNWNLLWYGVPAAVLLAGRQLASPALAPLTIVAAAGAVFLFAIVCFPELGAAVADGTTLNRMTLHFAPLAAVFAALALQAFAVRWTGAGLSADAPPA